MPFLRFSRDRRGYETTALFHAPRRQGRSRPRILYWFRTPTDARVGRAAFDEDAIRLIEEHHPDVAFDWSKILDVNPAAELTGEPAPPRGEPRGREGRSGSRDARRSERRERPRPDPQTERRTTAAEPALAAPADPEEATVRPSVRGEGETRLATAAEGEFSLETLAKLRGRYAALLSRIGREVPEPETAERLRQRAEALNPDTWVTADEVQTALEGYEQIYRELRDALGPRPRRRSRPPSSGSRLN